MHPNKFHRKAQHEEIASWEDHASEKLIPAFLVDAAICVLRFWKSWSPSQALITTDLVERWGGECELQGTPPSR